jgi:Fe-S-cluster containining protein
MLVYKCMKCGTCCYDLPKSDGIKRIPLYPEEVKKMINLAKGKNLKFQVIEDLVFPDILNKKILVLTYKILFNESHSCPFYEKTTGCTIHDSKPFACQAYPLSLKNIDAFKFELSIDPLCNYVIKNYQALSKLNMDELKTVFLEEYPKAELFFQKNKRLQMEIRALEYKKEILIPREITLKEFDHYLNKWERKEIIVE